jgi:D-lactate dehydrogenase
MTRIAFFDTKPYDKKSFLEENKNYNFEIKFFSNRLNNETAFMSKGFDVVCAFVNDNINKDTIELLSANNCKLIALRCAGYNNVDLNASFRKIHVAHVPAYSPYAVAEHTIALMLSLNRKTHKAYYRIRDNNFTINGFLGFDMHGKTAGIIGTGKIGKITINILKGFGLNILAYDYYPDKDFERDSGTKYTTLEEIYSKSDIISLHCPLTTETHHLINNKAISQMKDGVMIINTSRGGLIDTKALINGLKSKKIGSAGLDVYEEETEYFFEDFSDEVLSDDTLARLLSFNNTLITSHQAFFTKEALRNIATTTLNNIKEFFKKNTLENEICYQCGIEPCKKKIEGKCF